MNKKSQQLSHPEVDSWEKKLAHGDALTNNAPASMEYSKQNVKKKHIPSFTLAASYLTFTSYLRCKSNTKCCSSLNEYNVKRVKDIYTISIFFPCVIKQQVGFYSPFYFNCLI